MGCIYRIVCYATGRCYVGQTSYSHPFVRFREHQSDAKKGEPGLLYDDMRTYDISMFECSCIRVVPNIHLNDLECYYAEQFGAYVDEGGYNIGECGSAPVRAEVADRTREHMKRAAILKNIRRRH